MPYVGKLVKTRSSEDCAKSYSFLRATNLYFVSQNALTQPTAETYVSRLFQEAPQAKDAVRGMLAVVTGVTVGGAGYHMAEELALQAGMHVILLSRNDTKIQDAMDEMEKTAGKRGIDDKPTLYKTTYDLNSLASAKKAADFVIDLAKKQYGGKLHVLVNNAGGVAPEPTFTVEGIEANTGRNHICPHYFTELLIPILKAAATSEYKPRVVDVASMGHAVGIDFDPKRMLEYPKQGGAPEGWIVEKDDGSIAYAKGGALASTLQYCRAKMGPVATIHHLQKLHPEINFTSQQPGSIVSNFGSSLGLAAWIYYYGFYLFQYSPTQGAVTALRAALDPDFNTEPDLQGAYLHADGNPWTPASPITIDPATGEVYVWDVYAKDCYECTEKLIASVLNK